jgi:putative nucleotidyltransferase with HDIG domain
MFRAVRLAAVLAFEIDPATLDAMTARSGLASHLSGERIAAELVRLLAAPRPSVGLELLARTGLLASTIPQLAEQRGISQDKIPGDDLWAHTMRTVDAAPGDRPIVRLAALLHDIGKPATQADGRFVGHDSVGAEIADAVLRRLKMPRALADRVVHLVRNHMFSYEAGWSDAAVRRFIRRIGVDAVDDLLLLRHADDTGSGRARDASLDALRSRIAGQLEGDVALDRADLAVDGRDLIEALGLVPGPRVGRILAELLDRVLADPGLNDRSTLLLLARSMLDHES